MAMFLSLAGVSCFAQQNPPSRGRDVTKLYTEYCASCHGADMAGGSGPSLVDGSWHHGGDDLSLAASIRDGYARDGMPTMGNNFNAPEIRGLVIYIRECAARFKTAHTAYNAPAPGAIVKTEKASFKLEPVMETGLEVPWAIAVLPDGRMLITERPGRLRIIDHRKLLPEPVRGIPPVYGGEVGLLDVVLHPNYSRPGNDWIYLSYGDKSPGGLATRKPSFSFNSLAMRSSPRSDSRRPSVGSTAEGCWVDADVHRVPTSIARTAENPCDANE